MATSKNSPVFLVDDEPIQNEMLKDYLSERFSFDFKTFDNGEDAIKNMDLEPLIIILDYHLDNHKPDAKNGLDVLKEIKEVRPQADVIMLSGQDKIDVAVNTMQYGAYDYVVKGETAFHRVENLMNNIGELRSVKAINQGYKNTITLLSIVVIGSFLFGLIYFIILPAMS